MTEAEEVLLHVGSDTWWPGPVLPNEECLLLVPPVKGTVCHFVSRFAPP